MKAVSYIFGPIPSRRLGRSLGVDIIPKKLCTLDCIYCELGRTDKRALRRKEYVPTNDVIAQVKSFLADHEGIDVITFSGSGEPTLHSGLGSMIGALKEWTSTPVAVITNGTLLYREDVRHDLLEADIVLPSLDAATEKTFMAINRPHPRLHLAAIVEGLKQFRKEYRGQLWVEVLFVEGVNDSNEETQRMRDILEDIGPDKVQLNTVLRPPADRSAHPLSEERLHRLEGFFGNRSEVIGRYHPSGGKKDSVIRDSEVIAVLRRRAMTLRELEQSLEAPPKAVLISLLSLVRDERVFSFVYLGKKYYQAFESLGDALSV